MIRQLTSLDGWQAFVEDLCDDPDFSDPKLSDAEERWNKLVSALNRPDKRALGIYRGGEPTGLFAFLVLPEDRYLEMLVGLSREAGAWEEIAAWLRERYPGWQADFVFNPNNTLITALLERLGAELFPEQQEMVFAGTAADADTAGVELLSEPYREQYFAMHSKDVYWTGERVVVAPERFRTFVAVEAGAVVGYLDLTVGLKENEPVDLLVRKEARRRGWGRKLLAAALEANRPAGMRLLVDTDNEPALRLYGSMGFVRVEGKNNRTASWQINGEENDA